MERSGYEPFPLAQNAKSARGLAHSISQIRARLLLPFSCNRSPRKGGVKTVFPFSKNTGLPARSPETRRRWGAGGSGATGWSVDQRQLTRRRCAGQAGIVRRAKCGSRKHWASVNCLLSPRQSANGPVYATRTTLAERMPPHGVDWDTSQPAVGSRVCRNAAKAKLMGEECMAKK